MYVVRVVPIARGVLRGHLSFFSKEAVEPGMVVEVMVRGVRTPALVISVTDVRDEKAALRAEGYALKKLVPKVKRRVFPRTTINALIEIAHLHAAPESAAIAHLSPAAIIGALSRVADIPEVVRPTMAADQLVLQAESEERVRTYRNIAREAFARNESVLILAPTVPEAEALYTNLARGIEGQVVMATSASSKKAALATWNRAVEDPHPLLAIVTQSYLTLPRTFASIVVERESARSYLARERPGIDIRRAAEILARYMGARFILADFPLRAETRERYRTGGLEEVARLQTAVRVGARVRIVDVKNRKDDTEPKRKKSFSPLSDYAKEALDRAIKKGERAFIHAARRGIAPLTICNDCAAAVTDPATETPMTLQKTTAGNVFISQYSGALLPAETPCRICGGWNLISLGIGIDRVVDAVRHLLPESPITVLTGETAATHAAAKKLRNAFFATPGGIMIGTDRAVPYLEPVEVSVIASMDSILAGSAWRAHEHALHLLFSLRDKTEDELVIQTRNPDNPVMKAIVSGNPTDFMEHELAERERYGYPPFATFIGLTWSGTEATVNLTALTIKDALKGWDLVGPLPARLTAPRRYTARAVVRLPKDGWPNETLLPILTSLPPDVTFTLDPDEIV